MFIASGYSARSSSRNMGGAMKFQVVRPGNFAKPEDDPHADPLNGFLGIMSGIGFSIFFTLSAIGIVYLLVWGLQS